MASYGKKKRVDQEKSTAGQKIDARSLCLEILKEIEQKDAYLNLILNQKISRNDLSSNERGFLTELTHGVFNRFNTLDWVLSLYLDRPLEKLTLWIRNILRMGVYQLLYLEYIPDAAVVDESVKLAYRYGHKGVASFVNAVLRKISNEKNNLPWPSPEESVSYLSLLYSHPPWLVERWIKNIGRDEAEAFCRVNNSSPPLTVRINPLKSNREELKEMLKKEGVQASDCRFASLGLELGRLSKRLTDLEVFQKGLIQVQGESSMLVAPALNPRPGDTVLDLCSAPGGKAVHAALLMGNSGSVVASDIYSQRLKLVENTAEKQGVSIIKTVALDGRNLPSEMRSCFSRVLVDVPCSGLGVLRRKGDLKWRRKPEDVRSLSQLQLELLKRGFDALAPGGVLLYSACSTEPEETTEVINAFLTEEYYAYCTALSSYLPEELASEEKEEGMIYFWPHRHNLDGFFLSRIRKRL